MVKVSPAPDPELYKFYGSIGVIGATTYMAFDRSNNGPGKGAGRTCVV